MSTAAYLGRNAKLYLNTGSYGSPTWSEVANISDLTLNRAWDEAEANSRESSMKMALKTLLDGSVSGKMKFTIGDSNTTTILDALNSPTTALDIMCLNQSQTTTGAYGLRYPCQVTQGNEDQGLGVALYEDLKFMPTPSTNAPCTVKVVGGAPVFTAI